MYKMLHDFKPASWLEIHIQYIMQILQLKGYMPIFFPGSIDRERIISRNSEGDTECIMSFSICGNHTDIIPSDYSIYRGSLDIVFKNDDPKYLGAKFDNSRLVSGEKNIFITSTPSKTIPENACTTISFRGTVRKPRIVTRTDRGAIRGDNVDEVIGKLVHVMKMFASAIPARLII